MSAVCTQPYLGTASIDSHKTPGTYFEVCSCDLKKFCVNKYFCKVMIIFGVCFPREFMPSLDEFFAEAIEQADPVNMIEEEYKSVDTF